MAFGGNLASIDISAATNTLLYANTGNIWFKTTVNITNRNDEDVEVGLALVKGSEASDLANSHWLEDGVTIRPRGVILRSEISLQSGWCLVGYSNRANVNFNVWA